MGCQAGRASSCPVSPCLPCLCPRLGAGAVHRVCWWGGRCAHWGGGGGDFREQLWPPFVLSCFLTAPQVPSPVCWGVLPAFLESSAKLSSLPRAGGLQGTQGSSTVPICGVSRSWATVCLSTILHRFA